MKRIFTLRGFIRVAPYAVTLLWTMGLLLVWRFQAFGIQHAELRSTDDRFYSRGLLEPDPRLVFLAIDDGSILGEEVDEDEIKENPGYECLKGFPYHRKAWAMAIEKLVAAGAKMVVFDVVLNKDSPRETGPTGKADDESLAQAIRKHQDKVVLGASYQSRLTPDDTATTIPLMMPTSSVLPGDVPATEVVGFVNVAPDGDGIIRRAFPRGWPEVPPEFEPYFVPYSLSGLAIKKAFPEIRLPSPREFRIINYAGPMGTYPPIPFYLIFNTKSWQRDRPPLFGGRIFKDKIVVIGPRAGILHDEHLTPFGDGRAGYPTRMYGPEIHLHTMATLLSGRELHMIVPYTRELAFIAVMGLIYTIILPMARSPLGKLIPAFAFGLGYRFVTQWVFEGYDLFLPLVPVEAIVVGSTVSAIAIQAIAEQLEKRRVAGMFQQYVSKNIAVELMKSGQDVDSILAPQIRTVTMLFSDIRGFTAMTERSDPKQLFSQLNEYLTAMVECVFNNDGTLDKFVGDAVVAVFGSPASRGHADDAWNAVKTALDMRARLAELNAKWAKEGKEPWRIGIGLNHGAVMAGDIGSNQKKEFGVIGDPVNVAARVESETKTQKTDVLITDSVYQFVKDRVEVEARGGIKVKGRDKPVEMYALKGVK